LKYFDEMTSCQKQVLKRVFDDIINWWNNQLKKPRVQNYYLTKI